MLPDTINSPASLNAETAETTQTAATAGETPAQPKLPKNLSPRALAANRANALKSSGPKTPAGLATCQTAAAAQLTHGLRAKTILIEGESSARPEALLQNYLDTYRPVSSPEFEAIYRMVAAVWRCRRVQSFQTIDFNREIAAQDPAEIGLDTPAPLRATLAFRTFCAEAGHSSQAAALRYETAYERQYARALRDLTTLKALHKRTRRTPQKPQNVQGIGDTWTEEGEISNS